MQAEYLKKQPISHWDTLNTLYPTRKFPNTEISSTAIGHEWRNPAEVLQTYIKKTAPKEYDTEYNITNELNKSHTREQYTSKLPETKRFNKSTSSNQNEYVYSYSRHISQKPQCRVHGTSEMKSAYCTPCFPNSLVTNKDQYRRISTRDSKEFQEPSFHKEIPPMDTTYDGFEKYLDIYLTTNRLEHRPFTAEQLSRPSATKDTVTFYTYAKEPWKHRPKSVYDRNTFTHPVINIKEPRTHNRPFWVPGSFITETRSKFTPQYLVPESNCRDLETEVRTHYKNALSKLPRSEVNIFAAAPENSHYGSKKPLCSVLDQFVERNKRLEKRF